jgi:hypothetical protein
VNENKPEIALCCNCQKFVVDDEIVRWLNTGVWHPWCWPCFKTQHLTNLTRLQEGNK